MNKLFVIVMAATVAGGCAGRDAHPVLLSQPQDTVVGCAQINAEMAANNAKIEDLSSEKGAKVAQNVIAGVAGLFIWPLWFAMDFKDAAGAETVALQGRNGYLASLAVDKCKQVSS